MKTQQYEIKTTEVDGENIYVIWDNHANTFYEQVLGNPLSIKMSPCKNVISEKIAELNCLEDLGLSSFFEKAQAILERRGWEPLDFSIYQFKNQSQEGDAQILIGIGSKNGALTFELHDFEVANRSDVIYFTEQAFHKFEEFVSLLEAVNNWQRS